MEGMKSVVGAAWISIKESIEDLRYVYRYKHRFDKPPTAKCYCIDCKNYNIETQRCYGFHEDSIRLVADNMFCYRAEPRKKEESNIRPDDHWNIIES